MVAIGASAVVTFGASLGISAALIATAGTVAAAAGAISAISTAVVQATMKPPNAQGSISQVVIGRNLAVPLMLGRTYAGGLQVYDNSAGGSENKFRYQVMVMSGAGPIEEFQTLLADYSPVTMSGDSATGWFSNFLSVQRRLGLRPETAFTGGGSTATPMPEWGVDYKLSGFAAYRVKMSFDKEGKKFTSGVPQWGYVAKGIKVYDPRLDSTYPGGVGAHRWNDESTFTWSDNPALHALSYARGRFIEKNVAGVSLAKPIKIAGCGFAKEAIAIEQFVELANTCVANGWTVGGMLYEGPGTSKWDNIKRILQAAATEPVWSGGQLSLKMSSPKNSLVTNCPPLHTGSVAAA